MKRLLLRLRVGVALSALAAGVALLTPGAASAAFPGLNGKIAYVHQGVESSSIYSVNPDGSSPTNLSAAGTGTENNVDFQPAWDAIGKHIAFMRPDFQNCSAQIWVMSQDGTGQTNNSKNAADASEINPAYGPDGSIVFVRQPAGTFFFCAKSSFPPSGDLWIRNPDGTTRQLTTTGQDNTPAWSPDGTKIAFTRKMQDGPHILVMNADGSGTADDLGQGIKPNWSPDGSKIAFDAPGGQGQPAGFGVLVMNADGSSRQTLKADAAAPAWSPDGTKIAYVTGSDEGSFIGVMDANGQNQHNITSPGPRESDVKPDWQPLANVTSNVNVPNCSASGALAATVSDPSGFKSPPKAIHYRIDGGAEQTTATGSDGTATINVPEGRHTVEYWGENQAGDQEAQHHTVSVLVDKTRPTVRITSDQHTHRYRRGQRATITIVARDSGSGLARNPSRRHKRVSTRRTGLHRVRARAVDRCGNVRTASFRYRVVSRRRAAPRFTG